MIRGSDKKNIAEKCGLRHDLSTCRFCADDPETLVAQADGMVAPLSVILQVTRKCNFDCIFCSERADIPDPTKRQLETMRKNLAGVRRVFLSGGEPLLRRDLLEIAQDYSKNFIIGLPTNGSLPSRITDELLRSIAFVNIGFEGPRAVTERLRGEYDTIINGIRRFQEKGAAVSLCCVVLGSTVESVPFTCQMADLIEAQKLKLVLPIRKGNALSLPELDYLSQEDIKALFERLRLLKAEYDWRPRFAMTSWTKDTEGYSVLVQPNGKAYAWPVYNEENEMLHYLGNLLVEPIQDIWKRNPYKANHLKKYLGISIYIW